MKTFMEFISLQESSVEEQIDNVVENENERQALHSLYDSLSEDNREKFVERLASDTEKLVAFALTKFEE